MFLQWLVSKLQQSSGLGLLSVGIIDMYCYVPHMGVWDQTWVLVCAASTSPTEPSPQPFTCLSESDIFYSRVHSFSSK